MRGRGGARCEAVIDAKVKRVVVPGVAGKVYGNVRRQSARWYKICCVTNRSSVRGVSNRTRPTVKPERERCCVFRRRGVTAM